MGLFEGMDEKKRKKMRKSEFITRKLSNAGDINASLFEIIDNETGVRYIVHSMSSRGGITPRLNRDGTIMTVDLNELNNL